MGAGFIGAAAGILIRKTKVGAPRLTRGAHAGSGLPLVSTPNGSSKIPTTKAKPVSATGVPSD